MNERLPFHVQLRRERQLRGWSQKDLAEKIGYEPRTVMRWESGQYSPQSDAKQKLYQLFGKNAEEFGLLDVSLEDLEADEASTSFEGATPAPTTSQFPAYLEELEEAPNTDGFCGRQEECEQLVQWITGEHCQLVAILGLGGMGKTTLAAHVVQMVKTEFQRVFWRSLKNAPPLTEILKACLHFLQPEHFQEQPESIDEQISRLIRCLRERRCLLIFDNLETILQPGERAGLYRSGYREYEHLFRRIGEGMHDSCLLLTSREKPGELIAMEGRGARVNTQRLSGLLYAESRELLQEKILQGSDQQWQSLIERYAGNPLALKLVASSIQDLFDNQILAFLQEQAFVFDNIDELLDQHFERLTVQERDLLYWLAVERESLSRDALRANLVQVPRTGVLLETLASLHRRSLIEMAGNQRYFLQPVILEYVTTTLVQSAYEQFVALHRHPGNGPAALPLWQHFAFLKTAASDYVREAQARMILAPLAEQLLALLGRSILQERLKILLEQQRQQVVTQDYLAGNILNLLVHLGSSLRGLDCSGLVIRQAYLQQVSLPETNFARVSFLDSVFTSTFGAVLSVAFSPGGKVLAAGTANGDIWLYQMPESVLLHTCSGHTDGVWGLSFSSDGQVLASSSDDATVRLWNVATGEMRRLLTSHSDRVRSVAFSRDGQMLASGSDDRRICLWESASGRLLRTLSGHRDGVRSVAFHPSGRWLASGSLDRSVRLWDLLTSEQTEQAVQVFEGHSDRVRVVAFHPGGQMFASAGDDKTVRLWDRREQGKVRILREHTNRVWSLAFRADGDVLASGGEDCTVRLWESASGRALQVLQGHQAGVRSLAFDDTSLLASGADDQTIRLWESRTGRSLKTFQGYSLRVWSLAFASAPHLLASVSDDQALRLWDLSSGRCLKTVAMGRQNVRAIAASPTTPLLATVGGDQLLHLWDLPSGQHLRVLREHSNWVRAVAFRADGQQVASAGEDNLVLLWNPRTGQRVHRLVAHQNMVRALAFSPDHRLLASGGDDCVIYLWETQTGALLQTLRGHEQNVRALVFHPSSHRLYSASEDQTIRVWDCTTASQIESLSGHTGRVMGLDMHPQGSSLVSCGDDCCIRLWDLSKEAVASRSIERAHAGRIRGVLYSRDGSRLASCGDDGVIRLWDAATLAHLQDLISERPYERMNISEANGLTDAQKAALRILGAIEDS